jgi:hypothetical protein
MLPALAPGLKFAVAAYKVQGVDVIVACSVRMIECAMSQYVSKSVRTGGAELCVLIHTSRLILVPNALHLRSARIQAEQGALDNKAVQEWRALNLTVHLEVFQREYAY